MSASPLLARLHANLISFSTDQHYIESDSVYLSMESYDPTKLYLVTDKNRMLIMNDGFEIQGIVDLEQLYTLCLWTDNRKFLTRDKETILINHENKKIAVLQISPNALLVGKKLYDIQDKSFLELDLSGLVGEEN